MGYKIHVISYRGVVSHLSLMFKSTSLVSTRCLKKKRQKIQPYNSSARTQHRLKNGVRFPIASDRVE